MPVVCHYFVAAMACWLFGPAQAADGPEAPLRLVNLSPLDAPNMVAMRKTLDVAFARAGMRYTIRYLPPERALAAFIAGQFDGDPNRGPQFQLFFPDAVRIEPHLRTAWYFAVSASPEVRPKSWEDLKRYHIAFLRGLHGVDVMTRGVVLREMVPSHEACIRMAQIKRVDLCIVSSESADRRKFEEKYGSQLYSTQFEHLNIYLWLSPNQRAAADKLIRAMRGMAASGELQKLMGPYRADE
ncbi:substrate-binding periplasmic protein [Chromobacterium violaceum]|uniref:substrate-binding periplasmic protein n=1 Tax=Chromobacterium violaceum TaxID=536 RepID=UPI00143DB706|nr:transporter substrate-binding domain-containing protein [Chromobacterium violaceum]QIY79324.1 transporter substrate-binding domain-containing protein [Chromobacterium violaceum]